MAREINLNPNKNKAKAQDEAIAQERDASQALEIARLRASIGELEGVVEEILHRAPPEKVVERTHEVRVEPVVQETIILEDPRFSKLAADMKAIEKGIEQIKKRKPETVVVRGGGDSGSGGAGVTDGDKGDIIVSNSGATWAIDPSVLTAQGRSLIDDTTAAQQRSTIGLTGTGTGLAPAGGSTTQVLAKLSNSDYDYAWASAGAGGGGTQYAEDTAAVSGDLGDLVLAVRRDADGTQVSADGDYSELQTDASGFLKVIDKRSVYPINDNGSSITVDGTVGISGVVPVTDNAGSLTVDNAGTFAVQAAQSGTWNVGTVTTVTAVTAITNALPAGTNAIGKLSANSGVDIGDVDVTTVGTITPGTAATSLGKAEDAAHTSGDVGVMMLGVRQDADTSPVSATGDYQTMMFDANGYLKVNIKAGAGSGGTAMTDAAAFTRTATSVTPIAAVVETSAPTLTNGNVGALSLTTGGALRVAVASGGIAGVVEDVASAGAEEGMLAMTIRQDTIGSTTSADGDFQNLKTNSVGRLYTSTTLDAAIPTGSNVIGALTANQSVNVAQINGVTPLMGNGVTGTGSQRVTIASDNTAFSVNATEQAGTTGGMTPVSTVSAASTNATSLKASAGQVYSVTVTSVNAAMRYLKFYNKASAPTVGTDTPVYVVPIPGNTAGAGATVVFPCGLTFSTGIAWALTTGAAVADTGAVSASEHIVSIGYK